MSENSSKCYHFHTYDFMNDATFLKGWDKIKLLAEGDPVDQQRKLLQAKVFYYSKAFEPISTEEYKEWMEKTCSDIAKGRYGVDTYEEDSIEQAERNLKSLNIEKDGSKSSSSKSGKIRNDAKENSQSKNPAAQESKSVRDSMAKKIANDPENNTSDDPQYPTSFSEIVKIIEKGDTVPGVEQLNIQPTNAEPTPSSLERVPKPWEKS